MRFAPIIASLEIATGIGIAIFWVLFFSVGIAPTHTPPGYFAFEYSFVLSDIALSVALLIAGTLLYRQHPFGRNLSLACAGSLVFLGLVDFGFNAKNGIYATDLVDGLLAAGINLWCLGLGAFLMTNVSCD
jgi:hypothetical protein